MVLYADGQFVRMPNVITAVGTLHDVGEEHKMPLDVFADSFALGIRRAFPMVEWPAMSKRSASNGAEEIRTPDPHVANVVLYQLSYRPVFKK